MGDTALQASYPGPIVLQLRAVGADTQHFSPSTSALSTLIEHHHKNSGAAGYGEAASIFRGTRVIQCLSQLPWHLTACHAPDMGMHNTHRTQPHHGISIALRTGSAGWLPNMTYYHPLPSDTPGGRVGLCRASGRPFEGGAQGWGDVTHYLAG